MQPQQASPSGEWRPRSLASGLRYSTRIPRNWMPVHDLVASTLASAAARACGLCGTIRRLSKAHVPPQAAGNTTEVLRAPDVIVDRVRRPGRWLEGGMWVRGLCEDCNNRAGNHFDNPYADFARQVERLST